MMKTNTEIIKELRDRITRLESRLVQLMKFLGADPNGKYDKKQMDI